MFEAPLAAGILGAFVQAVSGGALYRKTTFLVDSLGKPVFAPHIQVLEDPHVQRRHGQRAVRRGRRAHAAPQRGGRRRGAGLFPLDVFGAQARHEDDRQRGRVAQSVAAQLADEARATTSRKC